MYLVMELLRGRELFEMGNKKGLEIPEKIKFLFRKICEVVKFVHDNQICHRDLKPENIFVNESESGVTLYDFGTAKDIEFNIHGLGNGSTGWRFYEHYVGTPQYMAPECIHNQRSDYKSDIYSLGGVLYFMVTGQPPYDGETEYLIFNKKINQEKIDFSDHRFTDEFIALINTMMSFDGEQRPTIDQILERTQSWDEPLN